MKTRKDFGLMGKVSGVNSIIEHKINQESWLSEITLGFDNEGRLTLEHTTQDKIMDYYYDDKGNCVRYTRLSGYGKGEYEIKYFYNTEDELIEKLCYHRLHSFDEFELQTRVEIIYTSGKKSEERIFWFSRPLPEQVRKYFYKDDVLHRFEKTHFNFKENSNETSYTEVELYDSGVRIVKQLIGTTTTKTFKYDNRGCLICELGFDNTGTLEYQNNIKYSDDGKIVSKEERNLRTGNNWDYTYKTDTVGNWVEEHSKKLSEVGEQSSLPQKDSTKKTSIHDFTRHHDREKRITTRTISYYD